MSEKIALTDSSISVLNAARSILTEFASNGPHTENFGRVAEASDTAASAIFRALNLANSYGGVPMTKAQLHNIASLEEKL
jgi:hypothetical protein